MYPHERSLVTNLAGKKFALIGVNSDRDIATPQKLTSNGTVTWRSFQNDEGANGKISDNWEVSGWPTIYLIDAEGKIRFKNVRGKALDKAIAELLGEIGEEFPAEAIEKGTEAEKKKKPGGQANNDAGDLDAPSAG